MSGSSPRTRAHPSPLNLSNPRKRPATQSAMASDYTVQPDTATIDRTKVHTRWLLESVYCSKVLGKSGSQLFKLRNLCGSRDLDAWISPNVPNRKFRVMNCIGIPRAVAKFAGLMVRILLDEDMEAVSGPQSKVYDLQILVPDPIMGPVKGQRGRYLRQIEDQSAAALSTEGEKLAGCDDRLIHVKGVADAIHIAIYYLCQSLIRSQSVLIDYPSLRQYQESETAPSGLESPRQATPLISTPNDEKTYSAKSTPKPSSNHNSAVSGKHPPLNLPEMGTHAPQTLRTAYETAVESKRPSLRQLVRVTQSLADPLETIIEKVHFVTNSTAKITEDADGSLIEIQGSSEDNALGLYIIYRHIC